MNQPLLMDYRNLLAYLARERSYWTNRIMGVYPVVWEVKVGA